MSLWRSIADHLREDIARGHHGPGERLPTEAALAARFGVNRHTVRQALAALADEGLVRSRRGAGVFIQVAPTDYPLGRSVQFHRAIALAGRVPGRQIDFVATRSADGVEAEVLGLSPAAAVHVAEGISLVDGQPVALFRSIFPAEALQGFPKALQSSGSITAALEACGVPAYRRAQTRITARVADSVRAARLHAAPGDALIRTEALNVTPDGMPVERGLTWWLASRITLTVTPDHA
ncbi:phosphonate metabolism transcriptional regulator PhnF [Paracoccus sp. S-4012]|uniref:phosphonate metabolism transcriptional regulator PhnF n=1 Tax=Paracoccus sp. S-4012 TaxID=2665648 RepID=UPI0012B057CF|nr:phosphonate metabolism transcriptional regulator PhnF [Paracoccus sp. S-4012]MRX52113.1 phosphonate metabolism transcriptional regulator PhnF [Paracoccus sp. S-4012]